MVLAFLVAAFCSLAPTRMEIEWKRLGLFHQPSLVSPRPQRAADEPAQRPSRARFQWPVETTTEDRLLVAFRCMQHAGFETVGEYFLALLDHKDNAHPTVYRSVAAFLQCQGKDARTHPVYLMEKIFRDPRSEKRSGVDEGLKFDVPRYALPPSRRLLPEMPEPAENNTHNALINWALHVIVARWKQEADLLLDPVYGFVRERRRGEPAEKFVWSDILNWSMTKNQETIAVNAPAMFTCLKKLDRAAAPAEENTSTSQEPSKSATQEPASSTAQEPAPNSHSTAPPGTRRTPDVSDPDRDLTDAENEDESLSTGVPPRMRRDPWLAITVTILVLLYFRYDRYAIVFPTFIGLFLFTCNAHKDTFALLSRLGLSIGYILGFLATDSAAQLHVFGAAVRITQPAFLLLFDNVNKMQRAWQQVLRRRDTLSSGCAATLIGLEDVTEDAMDSRPLLKNVAEKKRRNLTVNELVEDIDWAHLENAGAGTAAAVWTKHVPSLGIHLPAVTEKSRTTYAKHRLRLRKSVIHPMRLTDIDEAQTTGVAMELHNLVVDQLCILGHWLQCWLIMICGDQLSIDRIRKIKMYMGKGDTPFDRHDWALPVIQLWHLRWNWQKAIIGLHWVDETGKDIFGLHHDVDLLARDKFNPTKCDFYPAHHILEDRFDALMLDALRCTYFDPKRNGPLKHITFDELDSLSHVAYRRYMCNDAHEDTQGNYSRDPDSDSETEPVHLTVESKGKKKGKGSQGRKAKAAEEINYSGGDQCFGTTVNFIRMTFWYLEMCAAVADGDIGRVFEVVKVLRFSFWGAGSTNYGNELLELACNFLYEFPPALQEAILNNYLANTTGLLGHWLELDLLQEHHNFWIKRLFNSKSHSFDSKHLSEAVGLNTHGFSAIRDQFPGQFGFKKNAGTHKKADTTNDLNALGVHYREDQIMQYIPGRNGHGSDGKLAQFLERTTRAGGSVQPENEPVIPEEERLPSNPITSGARGVIHLSQFTVGDL
ncbi:hypothetical protein C8R47DRAFT_1249402 [Mycena vitilis]|nr:hypothetical protein C8R47DRAFT_1249402 [Mycena vitilis]